MRKALVQWILWITSALLLSACSRVPVGDLRISGAWAQATLLEYSEYMSEHAYHMGVGEDAPIYFRIINNGDNPDRLMGAASEVSADVVIWTNQPDGVIVPAGGSLDFSLGAENQLILKSLNQDLLAGRKILISLQFERAGNATVEIPVKLPRN